VVLKLIILKRKGANQMKPTTAQIARTVKEYSSICKEAVEVDFSVPGMMYVTGSELAMYRLHYKMACGRVLYSENLKTWCYSKEVNF
jgi:hypothetical protein